MTEYENDLPDPEIHPNYKVQNHRNRIREARNLWRDV